MDRGLLSDPRVLEASRDFVCARLLTYEDEAEGEFLKTIGGSATGAVMNTTFVLLAPDGETKLSRPGRSPGMSFRGAEDETQALLDHMAEIVERYPGNKRSRHEALPYLVDVRRALNAASSDNQPLVVVSVKDKKKRASVEAALAPLAWSPEFRGRFAFAPSADRKDLDEITGTSTRDSVFVVQPGIYGLEGDVLEETHDFDEASLRALLESGLARYEPHVKDARAVQLARRKGITWEEESLDVRTPDSDASSPGGRRRGEGRRNRPRGGGR